MGKSRPRSISISANQIHEFVSFPVLVRLSHIIKLDIGQAYFFCVFMDGEGIEAQDTIKGVLVGFISLMSSMDWLRYDC